MKCVQLRRRFGSTFAGVRVWLEQSGSFWRRLPLALKLGPSVLRWTKTRLQIGWGRVEIITLIVASRPRRKRPSAQTTDRCLAPSSQANSLISIIFVFFCLHEHLCFCWFVQQSWETSLNLCLLLFPLLVEAANPVNWVNFVFTLSDWSFLPIVLVFLFLATKLLQKLGMVGADSDTRLDRLIKEMASKKRKTKEKDV